MQQGLVDLLTTGAELLRPYLLALLAEVYGQRGQANDELHLLTEALVLVDTTEERWWQQFHCLKGDLLLLQSSDNHTEADACSQKARNVARNQQAKSLELRAATSLARQTGG